MLTFNNYLKAIKDKTIFPIFKIAFLFPDESVQFEIVEDMLNNGSVSINYNQGVRRSCKITLYNFHKKYIPTENSPLWIRRKFKLYLGVMNSDGDEYWQSAGVFVISNPNVLNNSSEKTITISGIDKFSLLDSQLGGELEAVYQITAGAKIYDAIKSILAFDNGNGQKIDPLEPILDLKYKDATLPYTITKEPGSATLGEILIELANSIACDIYYDTESRLRVQSGITDLSSITRPSLYDFSNQEAEYLENEISYQYDKVFNVVMVIGDNINGNLANGRAENINPFSPTRSTLIGKRTKVITDTNITIGDQALERSQYELKKISILPLLFKINCTFMVHFDVDSCVTITDDYYGYDHTRFLIQSVNIPLTTNSKISLDIVNIRDLPYYPA